MSIASLPSVALRDGRLVLRAGYDPALQAFFRSLAEGRFTPSRREYSALATPATAETIAERADRAARRGMATWSIDEETRSLAALAAAPRDGEGQPVRRKTDCWQHQERGYHWAKNAPASFLAMDMGTGKSKVVVDLVTNWQARKTLILCPLSVVNVWPREFERHGPDAIRVAALDGGSVSKKTASAVLAAAEAEAWKVPLVVVCNYESAWREPFASWALKQNWDWVVCDESHRAKLHNGKAAKFVYELGKRAPRRLCLSGTPMPHSPLDLFAQYRFLDAGIFGTSWTRFRQRYAVSDPLFPSKVNEWVNMEDFNERFARLAYRVRAADVLDLPAARHERRSFDLSPRAAEAYKSLKQNLIADLGAGVVTAANAMVALLRLQQLSGGFLPTDEGEAVELDTGKRSLLADILSDLPTAEPVVVFCRFRQDLSAVAQVAEQLGRRYGELSGSRRDLNARAEMPETVDLLGVQIQSGGVGVDLTRAAYAIYYSVGFGLGDFEQSLARLHRPGQTRPVTYYHLLANGTVDHAVYGALEKKRDVVEAVLETLEKSRGN